MRYSYSLYSFALFLQTLSQTDARGLREKNAHRGLRKDQVSKDEVGTLLIADIQYGEDDPARRLQGNGNGSGNSNRPDWTFNFETDEGFIYELTNVNPSWINGQGKGVQSGKSKIKLGFDAPISGGKIDLKGGNPQVQGNGNGNGNGVGNGNGIGNGPSSIFERRLDTSFTYGTRSVLAVRVIASNGQYNFTESVLSDEVFGTSGDPYNMVSQYSECSHGRLNFVKATDQNGLDTSISNGVVTITVSTSTSEGDSVMKNDVTAEIIRQFGVESPKDLADHVMYCLPDSTMDGIAYAYVESWNSVYSNDWCNYPSGQMHEIGHNLGFGHSGEGATYDDQSGMMGYSYSDDDGPVMCFNGHKSYFSGWFTEAVTTVSPFDGTNDCYQDRIYGLVDFDAATPQNKVIVKIDDVNSGTDYYIHFNRKTSFNSGTKEGGDQVMVSKADGEGTDYAKSTLLAKLDQGNSYTITSFGGGTQGNDVTISVSDINLSTVPAYAELAIIYPGASCTLFPSASPTTAAPTMLELRKVGNNGSPPEVFPLGLCLGDCDTDAECQEGLFCFQRSGLESVPGCPGDGSAGEDYCFAPPDKYLWKFGNNGLPATAFPLKECQGDCDNDSECAEGLVCMQRSADEAVPGCTGPGKSGDDYCMDPNPSPSNPTSNPTPFPTKSPSKSPTPVPTSSPNTKQPTTSPIKSPTSSPTKSPTSVPSLSPTTGKPTSSPFKSPTSSPTKSPTPVPSSSPTVSPTGSPTKRPTPASPTKSPTSPPISSLLALEIVGNNGDPAEVFPLGMCEGDCDVDSDCMGNLRCFQRGGLEAVPGCIGEGVAGNDYCAERLEDNYWLAGNNNVPAESFPLGACEGDCDNDGECAQGLYCMSRSGNEPVPGCLGEAVPGEDYCFNLPANYLFEVGNNGLPAEVFPLQKCLGDCDNDGECAAGLVCQQRSSNEAVVGCDGPGKSGTDYCMDPSNPAAPTTSPTTGKPTSSPIKLPTSSPSKSPTSAPLTPPSTSPTGSPTKNPTPAPSSSPSISGPTMSPSKKPTMPPNSLVTVGDNGSPAEVFPLGMCEGDCDVDADCEGTLRCFLRGALEAVPGCVGEGISGDDYCAEYLEGSFWLAGNNNVPAEAFPLGNCEGDCDNDSECAPGLYCMSRSGDEIVPGCSGGALPGEDYCFDLPENFLYQIGNNGLPAEVFPLPKCRGDCDNDSECAAGLVCQQRSGNEPVPGCDGPGNSGTDYCMDPMTPTSSPTPLPTSAPVLPTPNPTPAPIQPTPTSSPTSTPSCPPFLDTDSPTGPPNTVTYKPGENTATSNEGYLRISTGLLAEIIAESGSPVELKGLGAGFFSSDSFHSLPDGATVIEKDCGGGWYYVSNSESGSSTSYSGGVGAIEFDSQGQVVGYRRVLNNTRRNCGGGRTWWGTWITCEEVSDGLVYEVHPENPNPNLKRQTLIGATAGNYESVAYDKRPAALHPQDGRPRFFLTEDSSDGPLERFRPSQAVWNAAQQSGDYSDLLHVNDDGTAVTDYLFITPQSSGAKVGTFVWTSSIASGKSNAQSYYPNCEGIDIRDGMLYMTCKARKQLFILDLDAQTYVESSTATGAFSGQPDQIASLVGTGDNAGENIVYFCEDVGDAAGVHARDSTGEYYTIVQDEGGILSKETTGLAFSPDRKYMYVSYQMGYIYKIWRDDGRKFGGTSLDIKYHSDVSGPIFSL